MQRLVDDKGLTIMGSRGKAGLDTTATSARKWTRHQTKSNTSAVKVNNSRKVALHQKVCMMSCKASLPLHCDECCRVKWNDVTQAAMPCSLLDMFLLY